MAYRALREYCDPGLTVRFVANVDGADIAKATHGLDPHETLFIIASKTFTTLETMTNAAAARRWTLAALGDEKGIARHFVALSTNAKAVMRSASTQPTCSASGTGSADATRWIRPSGSPR